MRTAIATLVSTSAYSQSRPLDGDDDYVKPKRGEHNEYESKIWPKRAHLQDVTIGEDTKKAIYIPPMAFKLALHRAATMLGMRIPGKATSTYTKYFLSGILCMEPVILRTIGEGKIITIDSIRCDRIYAHANGQRGSGTRVWRMYPRVDEWQADVAFHLLSDDIPEDVFEEHLEKAGAFVGIGRYRPEVGGFYGRFKVENIRWVETVVKHDEKK